MRFGDTLPPELDHDPFKAILTPRPIGWIGSRSAGGVANLAPYSFFCGVCAKPNMVGFASEGLKHSFANAPRSTDTSLSEKSFKPTFAMNSFEIAGSTPRRRSPSRAWDISTTRR